MTFTERLTQILEAYPTRELPTISPIELRLSQEQYDIYQKNKQKFLESLAKFVILVPTLRSAYEDVSHALFAYVTAMLMPETIGPRQLQFLTQAKMEIEQAYLGMLSIIPRDQTRLRNNLKRIHNYVADQFYKPLDL